MTKYYTIFYKHEDSFAPEEWKTVHSELEAQHLVKAFNQDEPELEVWYEDTTEDSI